MAWTQADVDALKAAIATGALEVRYADGRYTKFRSLAEMKETLAMMQAEAAGQPPLRTVLIEHRRD